MNTQEHQSLKAKALRALAMREHSRDELLIKLMRHTKDLALIHHVLDECESANYLNNDRFVFSYLRARAQKYYGPNKIRYELQQRGIEKTLIEQALKQCEIDWETLKQEALLKKFGQHPPTSWQEKAKREQYLYQRGF